MSDPEDRVLGPPRTTFASASTRAIKPGDFDRFSKDPDRHDRQERPDRMSRNKTDTDVLERYRDGKNQNSALRRRGDNNDQDSEGWSTVKPRKSFGHEGAEHFQGRMGGALERFTPREDRKHAREGGDRDSGDRRNRTFDQQPRDKDGEDSEGPRWHGLNNRTRTEREPRVKENSDGAPLSQRDRIDRASNWRDRAPATAEKHNDRQSDRGYDRRSDRDHHRNERVPEWDNPLEEEETEFVPRREKPGGHSKEDFEKFREEMRAKDRAMNNPNQASTDEAPSKTGASVDTPNKMMSVSAIEAQPSFDKFFAAVGGGNALDIGSPSADARTPGSVPKPASKSRFTNFFSAQQLDTRSTAEPSPAPAAPAPAAARELTEEESRARESEAFKANILSKLMLSAQPSVSPLPQGSQPPPGVTRATPSFSEHSSGLGFGGLASLFPSMVGGSHPSGSAVSSPGPLQQYGGGAERREDPRVRGPQPPMGQDLASPPLMRPPSEPPAQRHEINLHDILHGRAPQGFGGMPPGRTEQSPRPPMNKDRTFLLSLIGGHVDAPDALRTEQLLAQRGQPQQANNMPPMTQGRPMGSIPSNEQDMHREREQRERERGASQRQMRPNGLPDFFEQPFRPHENDNRPQQQQQQQQPTQILQRQPPPGLDQRFAQMQMGPGPMPPPGQHMIPPPPGLMNRDSRNANVGPGPGLVPGPGMFPPNFGPGGFPPGPNGFPNGLPEGLVGPGPGGPGGPGPAAGLRGPPPGLYNGGPPVPPGFMMSGPQHLNLSGGFPAQGGLGPDFGPGPLPPFDGRNLPPPPGPPVGHFRRP